MRGLRNLSLLFLSALYLVSNFVFVAWADDRRVDRSTLILMTLNAEFLWDGIQPEEGQVNFPWKGSRIEAEEHMQDIANLIIIGQYRAL